MDKEKLIAKIMKECAQDGEPVTREEAEEMARMVKLADRVHNLSETPLASDKFKEKYIKETEEWYLDLAKDTVFEEDIKNELQKLKESYKQKQEKIIREDR